MRYTPRAIYLATTVVVSGLASMAQAQVVDGSITQAEYGAPLVVQDTPTGFGDNLSELNAAFANYVAGTGLYLGLTGNIEANSGNGIVVFVDSKPGGGVDETTGVFGSVGGARTDDWGTDTDGGQGSNNNTPSVLNLGFNPDYSLEINISDGDYHVNVIDLTLSNDGSPNVDRYLGSNTVGGSAVTQTYTLDGGTVIGDITHAFDNSNTAGVIGFDFANPPGALGDPLSATTGFEALLSDEFLMTALNPTGEVHFLPFITNGGGDFLSNQFLPGVGGLSNLGGPGGDGGDPLFDANTFEGNMFITAVVPEPTSLALLGLGGLTLLRRRR